MGKKENKKEKDALFKHHFSHRQEVIDFLKLYLSVELFNKIDLTSLRELKREYRLPDGKGTRHVDLLWEAKLKDGSPLLFLFHFEAQGYHDKTMMGRVLTAHSIIGVEYLQQGKKIPTIITFVLYHGSSEWTSPQSIADAFEDFDTYLDFSLKRPIIIDLPRTPIKELKKSNSAFTVQALLAKESSGDMKSIVKEIIVDIEYQKPACCRKRDIDFLFAYNKGKNEEILKELRKLAPRIEKKYSSMFEKVRIKYKKIGLEEGRQEGKREGRAEGRAEGRKEVLTTILQKLEKLNIGQKAMQEIQNIALSSATISNQ